MTENDWKATVQYATFHQRFSAFLVDFLIILIPLSLVMSEVFNIMWGPIQVNEADMRALAQTQDTEAMAHMIFVKERLIRLLKENIVFAIISGAVWISFWHYRSATPGKMLFKIKVVDAETGGPCRMKQYIIRYIGILISGTLLGIGFLWLRWNKRARAWHDFMAGTVVVKKNSLPEESVDRVLDEKRETSLDQ